MSLSNRDQRMLFESAIEAATKTPETVEVVDADESIDKIEAIVMDYINNAIPANVNESTSHEEIEQHVAEAVINLNSLCAMVNEYFDYRG